MIYGDRVRQIRELRCLTQGQLAEAVGVSQSAIAQIENSLQQPLPQHVQAIADHTGFPISFFEQPTLVDFPAGSLLFRARATTSGKERTEAYRYAQTLFEATTELWSRIKPLPLLLPSFVGGPADAARITRASMGLPPDKPIDHLINSVEKAGVLVLALPVHLAGRDAFAGWVTGERLMPWMALSSGAPGDRLRWSTAHEFAHLVLHRAPRGRIEDIEQEADAFAAEFLLPEAAMAAELVQPVTLSQLAPLKARWKVSIQSLVRRARELRILTERQYKAAYKQIVSFGWRVKEPVPLQPERPRAFRQMAELLYGKPIDAARLAEDLHFKIDFARDFIEQYVGADLALEEDTRAKSNVIPWRTRAAL
jgi:Zn-dependent peptidase ImmA (M78 family)/transcriptional regulator with XRE-family HTH domain